jgi:mRNA interferase MazF
LIAAGQIVLFRFPQTDQGRGKWRPALVLRRLPGPYDDWLICMISSRLHQAIAELDEVVAPNDPDFPASGLKTASLIRTTRVAVVAAERLEGALGHLATGRLDRIRARLAAWLVADAMAPVH